MRVRMTGWPWTLPLALFVPAVLVLSSGAIAQEKTDEKKTPDVPAAQTAPPGKQDDKKPMLLPPVVPPMAAVAQAVPKQDDKKLPVLPPTKVEAVQTPPTTTPPTDIPPVATPAGNPITNGGIFGSAPVQGYRATTSTTGTKIDTPLINYPGSLSVIPIDLIKDQNALNVSDLIRNIPGAVNVTDFAQLRDNFFLRGFEMASRDFRYNGFTDPSYVARDFFDIERVEVMTGPASVLYGAGSPSGTINFVTKQPLAEPYDNFQFTFGSFNLTRYTIDTTGPIDDNGNALYRINAAYQQMDSFRDFGWSQRTAVAPVFAFMIDPDTVLTFEGSYQDTRRQLDTGLIFYNNAIQGPINRSFNEPGDYQRVDDYKSLVTLLHKFGDDFTGRLQFFNDSYNYTTYGTMPDVDPFVGNTQLYNAVAPFFGQAPLGPTQILRDTESTHLAEQFYDIRAEIAGKWDGMFVHHSAVIGAEVGWYHSDFTGLQSDPTAGFTFFTPPTYVFNFANPVYGNVNPNVNAQTLEAHIAQERYGLYGSDLIEITDRLKVLVGLRYDIVNTDFANSFTNNNAVLAAIGQPSGSFPLTIQDRIDYHLSPRVGLVYQPIPEVLSFYATYVQSFDPPVTGVFATPTTLLPETGTSGEIGVKLDLFEKRLSLQAAGYIIDKHNVVAQENFITSVQIGEIRSSGAELSAVGKITRDWSIVANYSYCDSRIVSDPADAATVASGSVAGNRFRGVPFNSGNVWMRYNLIDNCCQTLGVGVGLIMVGDRYGDLGDDFVLPGYTRVDAGIFYKRGLLNAAVYFENIGGTTYYSGSFDANTVTPGTPFNVRATLGITF